jgi:hypothetical protein
MSSQKAEVSAASVRVAALLSTSIMAAPASGSPASTGQVAVPVRAQLGGAARQSLKLSPTTVPRET